MTDQWKYTEGHRRRKSWIYTIFGIWRKDKDGTSPEIYTEMKYMIVYNEWEKTRKLQYEKSQNAFKPNNSKHETYMQVFIAIWS